MKQTRYICKWLFLFCLGMISVVWSGCAEEITIPEEEGMITFQLSLPPALDITTRGGALDYITISDVWVLQYNENTGAFIMGNNFSGDAIGNTETNQTIKVTTSNFSNVKSNFYIIVNAGTGFLTDFIKATTADRSEAALKKKTVNLNLGETVQPSLLTCGPLKYSPDATGKVVLVAPLQHPCARIAVQWNKTADFKGSIEIDSVKVKNLPQKMALYSRGGGKLSDTYPVLSEIATGFVVIRNSSLDFGTPCFFYMPENLRGTGTATSFPEKGLEEKGPNGTLAGCTCVVLTGNYKYPKTSTEQYPGIVKVEYRIYLGGNLLKDYNIQRGYEYKLAVNISGVNSGDIRVTITDGAVVVFDDVETIKKEVEFK
ncbi:DUF4906 domain-containing protein [Bacteroides sp.]|uniref:DUF4906 domain-containing protein n=1 Tax=Bacteroides sp. TaxID=29523 RepID=UPI00260DAA08|nr:DUF4906 domain-containing protein [Bacteroides sp.]